MCKQFLYEACIYCVQQVDNMNGRLYKSTRENLRHGLTLHQINAAGVAKEQRKCSIFSRIFFFKHSNTRAVGWYCILIHTIHTVYILCMCFNTNFMNTWLQCVSKTPKILVGIIFHISFFHNFLIVGRIKDFLKFLIYNNILSLI